MPYVAFKPKHPCKKKQGVDATGYIDGVQKKNKTFNLKFKMLSNNQTTRKKIQIKSLRIKS